MHRGVQGDWPEALSVVTVRVSGSRVQGSGNSRGQARCLMNVWSATPIRTSSWLANGRVSSPISMFRRQSFPGDQILQSSISFHFSSLNPRHLSRCYPFISTGGMFLYAGWNDGPGASVGHVHAGSRAWPFSGQSACSSSLISRATVLKFVSLS